MEPVAAEEAPVAVEEHEVQEAAEVGGELEAGEVAGAGAEAEAVTRHLLANAGSSKSECPSGSPAVEQH